MTSVLPSLRLMPTDDGVSRFIKRFHDYTDVDSVFTNGCCYWFAYIIKGRFDEAKIMYDSINNHFGTMINDRVYDVTGDVTDKYSWEPWENFDDELEKSRIVRDCIKF